jgi:hypothetical protein
MKRIKDVSDLMRGLQHSACAALFGLVILLTGTGSALAQDECLVEAYEGNNTPSCTAEDVRISVVTQPDIVSCILGEEVVVDLQVSLLSGAVTRYDIGMFFAQGEWDAKFGAPDGHGCYRDFLNPPGADNVFNKDGGPYRNRDNDACAEILAADGTNIFYVDNFTYTCADLNDDGVADLGTCLSWDNNSNTTCNGVEDAIPGTGSKCRCEILPIGNIELNETGLLEVQKVLNSSYGLVNLQIDGTTEAADVGDGGTTGEHEVSAGTNLNPGAVHTVGETAGTGTSLANYDSISIECRGNNGAGSVVASANNAGPLDVTVNPDDDIVCVITNTAICNPTGVDCSAFDSACGVASCDPAGTVIDNCDNLDPVSATTICREANGVCDVEESCDGVSTDCPVDGYAGATTICRAADGVCDVEESCTGS